MNFLLDTCVISEFVNSVIGAIALTYEMTIVTRNVDRLKPTGAPALNPRDGK